MLNHEVNLEKISEFLVLNPVFPRSVSFSITELERHLKAIQNEYRLESISKVIRLAAGIKGNSLACLKLEDVTINQLQLFSNELLVSWDQLGARD